MKTKIFFVLVALAAAGALIFGYLQMSKERTLESDRDKPVAAKSRASLNPNGQSVVTLDAETQQRIGLKAAPPKSSTISPEIKGYGRVLDPAPLAALVAELDSARAGSMASQKEFERLKLLREQNNASERALQAAESSAQRDQILVESVRTRLISAWGAALGKRTDLNNLVESLAPMASVLVRIDLRAGEELPAAPGRARIVPMGAEDKLGNGNSTSVGRQENGNSPSPYPLPGGEGGIEAELVGPASSVDPQIQGQGFLYLVKSNSSRLTPGMALSGYLPLPGEPLKGSVVPDSAVVRFSGHGWIYVQTGDQTFTRREIALDRRMEEGWFVSGGFSNNERVVISGAQALLSEEQKYQIKMLE